MREASVALLNTSCPQSGSDVLQCLLPCASSLESNGIRQGNRIIPMMVA
jgi:hypothetical protein